MHRKNRLFLSAIFGVALLNLANANQYSSDATKCSIEFPNDWTIEIKTPLQFSAASPDQVKRIVVNVTPLPDNNPWTDKDTQSYEAGLLQDNWTIENHSQGQMDGMPVYITNEKTSNNDAILHMKSAAGVANSYYYTIAIVKQNGNPAEDAQLKAIFTSFHFTDKPKIPKQTTSTPMSPN